MWTIDRRECPKAHTAWGYYNMGRLIGIAWTRKSAIEDVEAQTGDPWKVAKKYMEVHRIRIEVYAP